MLNIFSLSGICLNSDLYSIPFLFAKLPEAYAFLNPIVDLIYTSAIFSLSLCLASCCKLSLRYLMLF